MLVTGGICDFSAPTVPSGHREAQISPAPARAPDRLLDLPDWSAEEPELSEGLPMPREPAYAAERSQDGEAQTASV